MKDIKTFINEEKKTTGAGSVDMIKFMINELEKKPDYKGKDKELWNSASYFLYDYLKELSPKDYEHIVNELGLADLRNNDKEKFSAAAVQGALALKLTK